MQKSYLKTLGVIYQLDESYENLHNLDYSASLHQRNVKILVAQVFKSASKTNPLEFIWSYFSYETYRIISGEVLLCHCHVISLHSTNFVHFNGTFIENNLLYFIKSSA